MKQRWRIQPEALHVAAATDERAAVRWLARRAATHALVGYALYDVRISAEGMTCGLFHAGKLYWLVVEPGLSRVSLTTVGDERHATVTFTDLWDERSIAAQIPEMLRALG